MSMTSYPADRYVRVRRVGSKLVADEGIKPGRSAQPLLLSRVVGGPHGLDASVDARRTPRPLTGALAGATLRPQQPGQGRY